MTGLKVGHPGRRTIGPSAAPIGSHEMRKRETGGFTLIELPVVRKRKSAAFTLIELLTVISILAILVGILVPSVTRAVFAVRVAETTARITAIKAALGEYQNEHGFFPGQDQGLPAGLTGSQLLARAMFIPKGGSYPANFPNNSYMDYKPDMLCTFEGKTETFGDGFPEQMAFCYYPARLNQTGLSQFHESDNSVYTDGNRIPSPETFNDFITDERFGQTDTPVMPNKYILIAPGIDRKYFTEDDVTNR